MELDQFKDVNLVIDKANNVFIQRQFVSQGDYKGRTLTVQITNNGSIGEVPGLTLNLNWHNEASGLTDLTAFTILDKKNSIFRIEYPENMMTPGKVYASIQIIQDGKVTNLKQFELIVQKLAGQPVGIVEKAEFSALVAVLADSNKFRTDIDSLSASKADKNYINNYLSKVTVVPETFANLAAIKAKYPNGANGVMVAADNGHKYIWANNVWNDAGIYQSVGIADGSITPEQLQPLTSFARFVQTAEKPPFFDVKTLTLHCNGNTVISRGYYTNGVADEVVCKDTGFIVWSQADKKVYFVYGQSLKPDLSIIGTVTGGFPNIIGVSDNADNNLGATVYVDTSTRGDHKVYIDRATSKIDIPNLIVLQGQHRYLLTAKSIDLPADGTEFYLVCSPQDDKVTARSCGDTPQLLGGHDFILGYYSSSTNQWYGSNLAENQVQVVQAPSAWGGYYLWSDQPLKVDYAAKTIEIVSYAVLSNQERSVTLNKQKIDVPDYGAWVTFNSATGKLRADGGASPANVDMNDACIGYVDCSEHEFVGAWGDGYAVVSNSDTQIGSSIYYLGDSITVGFRTSNEATNNYPYWINKATHVPYISNAITGSKVVCINGDGNSFSMRFNPVDIDGFEKLVVFGGHNDFKGDVPLGDIDGTDIATFYGALNTIAAHAYESNPMIKLYFICPNWRVVYENDVDSESKAQVETWKNGAGLMLSDYIDAIKQVAAKYHAPVLDLYTDWGVYRGNQKQWLVDGLHPNDAGQKYLARTVQGFLESH